MSGAVPRACDGTRLCFRFETNYNAVNMQAEEGRARQGEMSKCRSAAARIQAPCRCMSAKRVAAALL